MIELEIDYGDLKNLDLEITSNNTLLSGSFSAKYPILEEMASMLKFDIIWSYLQMNPIVAIIDQEFLTSKADWECESMRDICIRILEFDRIYWVINKQFGLRTRYWQVSILIDIIMKNKNMCTITDTNTSKSHRNQTISVVLGGSILVISSTITFMED